MKYNFDALIERRNTGCFKWDGLMEVYGTDDLLSMWIADMDFSVPPAVLEALRTRLEHPVLGYTYRLNSYYDAIKQWIAKRHNWDINTEWICNTPGIVPALAMAVLSYTSPGDKVLIQSPVYHPFYDSIEKNDRILVNSPLLLNNGHYEMDYQDIEAKLASGVKMAIICNPHNPVGRVWTRDELRMYGNLCKKYNVVVISDEIHSDVIYSPNKHTAFSSFPEFQDFSLSCFAPSKTFNVAGLCTSSIIIPNKELREKFIEALLRFGIYMGNIFGIEALEACYRECEDWLEELLSYLKGNLDYINQYLKENIPQVTMIYPEGTYLAWLNFQALNISHEELSHLLIHSARIGLDDGLKFGTDGCCFMRMNFACPRSVLEDGLHRIKKAILEFNNAN